MSSIFQAAKQRSLDQFREKELEEEPSKTTEEEVFKPSIFQSSKKLPPKEPEASTLSNVGRQVGRTSARIAETALGAPRALGEFLESMVPEKALIAGAEKLGLEKGAKNLLETTKKYAPYKLFPTSEKVREFNKSLFGENIEPKNKWERKADELVSDFTALSLPFPGQQLKLVKPALLALGGNVASDIVGRHGAGEKAQTYTKLGTILFGSMIHPGGANKLAKNLYDEAKAARPADASVSAANLQSKAKSLRSQLEKGGSAESKTKALKKLDELEGAIKNGKIEVEELEQFKKSINEASAGLYDEFKTNKPGRNAAKKNLQQISKLVDNTLTEYGKTNPQWEGPYRAANEVYGAVAQSKKVRNWLSDKKKALGPIGALSLFGLEKTAGIPATAITAAAGTAGLFTGEIATQIAKSPELAKYYSKVVSAALRDDIVAARENLKKLDEELNKDKKSPR